MKLGGSSGATVVLQDGLARKTGNGTREQWRWLSQNRCSSVVDVLSYDARDDVMLMELLQPMQLNEYLDVNFMANTAVSLCRAIWSKHPVATLNPNSHCAKVNALAMMNNIDVRPLKNAYDAIDWHRLPTGLTHGDPTFENIMRRSTESPVLIDPRPATPQVPDMQCVDIGKVVQSMYGWERMRHNGSGMDRSPTAHGDVHTFLTDVCLDENEMKAASYWHVVHLLRTLPYAPISVGFQIREAVKYFAQRL